MYRIRWKIVLLLSILFGMLILCVRGCRMAKSGRAGTPPPRVDASETLCIYDHRQETDLSLPMETYLIGVVAAEMPASFHVEALKAQAVAARTYTQYKKERSGCRKHAADVCTSSACCQAYASVSRMRENWGNAFDDYYEKVSDAVFSTAGEVLTYDGALIEALYHASSGGYTEDAENVFSAASPYLRSVESGFETGTGRLSDTVSLDRTTFVQRINERFPSAKLTDAALEESVEIIESTPAGRVQRIRLGGDDATGREMRSLFQLDSTLFAVRITNDAVIFDTRGFGHGVGMSQTGANGLAQQGQTYIEILKYYYTGVSVG